MASRKIRVLFVFGTRPEALKLAPVVLAAQKDKRFRTSVCLTAQHREMVDQVLGLFRIKPHFDLNLMEKGQTLGDLTQRLFARMEPVLHRVKPDIILVQGDTTTAFAVALKAFYHKIPVGHVEAGLRSHDKYHPFPEEINRVLISHLADFHFAPTQEAKGNLLREGVTKQKVFVTGNTVVDALRHVRPQIGKIRVPAACQYPVSQKMILVTAHRRESFGKPLQAICRALRRLAAAFPDTEIVYPVHLNPQVQGTVNRELKGRPRIHLVPPLSYEEFLVLMERCFLILTDSGGIQEEAPSFGKPVLVMRDVSERPDGIRLGVAKLVGTSESRIYGEASRLLKSPKVYSAMVKKKNPYGDGKASQRILDIISTINSDRLALAASRGLTMPVRSGGS